MAVAWVVADVVALLQAVVERLGVGAISFRPYWAEEEAAEKLGCSSWLQKFDEIGNG